MVYWAVLVGISVAGWNRQLARSRRYRPRAVVRVASERENTPSVDAKSGYSSGGGAGQGNASDSGGTPPAVPNPPASASFFGEFPDLRNLPNLPNGSQVATDLLDAADKRVPTLSVNARRKYFHALAVVMFLPGVAVDVS